MFLLTVLDFQSKLSRILAKITQHGCHNCILRVQGRAWEKLNFLKTYIFQNLVNLVKKVWTTDEIYSTGLPKLKSTFPESRSRIFLKKLHFLHSFRTSSTKNYAIFGGETPASLLKMQFGCPVEHVEKKTSFWKHIFVLPDRFWTWSHSSPKLWQKYFNTFVPAAFYVSKGNSWAKLIS